MVRRWWQGRDVKQTVRSLGFQVELAQNKLVHMRLDADGTSSSVGDAEFNQPHLTVKHVLSSCG